jgi:RNA binding exosome subunit
MWPKREMKLYHLQEKVDGTGEHHVKQNKQDSERQIPHVLSHMQS